MFFVTLMYLLGRVRFWLLKSRARYPPCPSRATFTEVHFIDDILSILLSVLTLLRDVV